MAGHRDGEGLLGPGKRDCVGIDFSFFLCFEVLCVKDVRFDLYKHPTIVNRVCLSKQSFYDYPRNRSIRYCFTMSTL